MEKPKENKHWGEWAELQVEKAAQLLIARNKFFVEYIYAAKIHELDSRKIDGLLLTRCSLVLAIQVKSSDEGIRGHYEDGFKKGKPARGCEHILAIAPRKKESLKKLSRRIEKFVYSILKKPELSPRERYRRYLIGREKTGNPPK
ncbi:MAG: hypothetical protein A2945_05480 [Candidatus Liptonbacteria bacterium RIFCSPLOWO2_01_FULL_52_25]|uniref:Uncharacterized protein n=1 Tax=Candidatus Liptonbacteria bacterium RIFCSPLOWO2_01_FULL_52_25 TaxID=1798650 RepID=A0A1G2CEN4_9BACT|nr:MAG: hypothetical protein A2945_05480 [Candidatus Liptonbacteria bacterium RIFCSPLOWO2_01_FULL_52_25]